MSGRRWTERCSAAIMACALATTACGNAAPTITGVTTRPTDTGETSETSETGDTGGATDGAVPSGDSAGPVERRIEVDMPRIPVIALPDISILGETGDVVADRLGDLITPVSGVDLIAATCEEDGGDLIYRGSTGNDVFDIDRDGSGRYYDESENGLVTLEVEADGSGRFYDAGGTGLITIDVLPDGSGTYYNQRPEGLVTVKTFADGSGEYYDDRDGLLTINVPQDGGGQYYSENEDGLLTINVQPDGSGQYYRASSDTDVVTIDLESDGGWRLSRSTPTSRIEMTIDPDGSGRYVETGLDPVRIDFDPEGRGQGATVEIPPAPSLAVGGRFPPLGKLGSLAPPCAAVIRFDSSLLFEFDEAEIRAEADDTLDAVAAALVETAKPIEINGHSDSLGSDDYNLDLSLRRAEAVETALRSRGLTIAITVNGYGETRPVAPNQQPNGDDDPAGRAQNRRVEIVIRE